MVDGRKELGYEFRRWYDWIFSPLLGMLSPALRPYVTIDPAAEEVVKHRTTHYALDLLYLSGETIPAESLMERLARSFWFNTQNARGVRNRLRLVTFLLDQELSRLLSLHTEEPCRLLSIASGSARAVLDATERTLKRLPEGSVHITLLDKELAALSYSRKIAEQKGLTGNTRVSLSWVQGTAESFVRSQNAHQNRLHLIEMVGLLDYFQDKKAISLFEAIYQALNPDGAFITANIVPNWEQKFVSRFVEWPMVYRTHDQLASLLLDAGFSSQDLTFIYEPLKTHVVAVARKPK